MRESEHITDIEMRTQLRAAYSQDPEKSILAQLAGHLGDTAMPRDATHRLRVHPFWMILGLIAAFVASVFVFFSLRS